MSVINETQRVSTPTAFAVAKEHIQTPLGVQRFVIWPALRTFQWMEVFGGELSPAFKGYENFFKYSNHIFYWIRHPETLRSLGSSIVNLKENILLSSPIDIAENLQDIYINSAFSIEHYSQTLKKLNEHDLISLTPSAFRAIRLIGFLESVALCMIGVSGLRTQLPIVFSANSTPTEKKAALIKTVMRVALGILGIFGVSSYLFAAPVGLAAWAGVATVLLIARIADLFFEKLVVEPEKLQLK